MNQNLNRFVTAEVERYMAWPGQALSYKIGELTIESLRDKSKAELGTKFSLQKFSRCDFKRWLHAIGHF